MNREEKRKLNKRIKKVSNELEKKELVFNYLFSRDIINDCYFSENNNSSIQSFLDIILRPSSIKSLSTIKYKINEMMSFNDTFKLSFVLCSHYSNIISQFVELREKYERHLFLNEDLEAQKVLTEIIEKCGWSIWACGQKLILEENISGLEGNKKLLNSFIQETKRNRLVIYLLEFLSYRAEENTSLKNYNEKVDKFLRFFNDDVFLPYFSYKLKIQDITTNENLKYALQLDMQLSIIDLYLSTLNISQREIVTRNIISDDNLNNIGNLYNKIPDYQLRNISIFMGEENNVKYDESVINIVEKYTIGEYKESLVNLEKYLELNPTDFQMWILFLKCNIFLNSIPQTKSSIFDDIFSIYALDENCVSSHNKLLAYLKKYSDTTWKYKLLNTTKRKLSFDEKIDKYITLSLLSERTISPRFISMIPDTNLKKKYLDSFKEIAPNSFSLLCENKIIGSSGIMCFRSSLYESDSLIIKKDYPEAIKILSELYNSSDLNVRYIKEKVIRKLYNSLCESNRIEEAINIAVSAYFENENFIRRCDLKCVNEQIINSRSRKIYSNIEYPIFIYISNKFDFKEQRIAFSNFLDSNNVKTKADFFGLIEKDSTLNVFFMEKICNMDVIKRHVTLVPDASAAINLRIELLQKLILLNPGKKKEYLLEISSITTRREIYNRVRQVTQHKIKVDTDRIKEENREIFEENFQKYLQIKSFNNNLKGFDINNSDNVDFLKQVYASMNEAIKTDTQYSQTILALKDFITDIQYAFLRNEKYGLDNYLSSRIRHGYCKAQLTKDLREYHLLLSSSEDDSERFDICQYWDERVEDINSEYYKKIKTSLSQFTLDVENKITEIRRDWIRIRINRTEIGLFDYTSLVEKALAIDNNNINDFDEMYSIIIDILWSYTNKNLEIIREKIRNELKEFFNGKLNELEKRVMTIDGGYEHSISQEILNAITLCRVKIQNALNEFEKFFYRDDIVYKDFSLEDLAITCVEIEKQIHANFNNIKFKKIINGVNRFKGCFFSDFVEIIVLLMNNSILHAGFSDMSLIELTLDFSIGTNMEIYEDVKETLEKLNSEVDIDNFLVISVKNNLSADKDIKKIEERVQFIFDNAKDSAVLKKYSITEGGSGLYKIYKTVDYNVKAPYAILYSVEEKEFVLWLAVDASTLLVEEDSI